jgi:glycosyltransferase involved in cell wall biosynthesis
MNTVILHDWLVSPVGGAEKVLEEIHKLFPSPIYTLVSDRKKLMGSYFDCANIQNSFIQKLPKATSAYRSYLPFFPLAIEQFDLSSYELILSSSHCVAKGAIIHPEQLHICYCHTPIRYAWDMTYQYLKEADLDKGLKGFLAKWILHYIRGWDMHSSTRVDHFIANSKYVASRIKKFYGRSSTVIYPPVNLDFFHPVEKKESFYLTASRLIPYKKIDLIVEAFTQMPDRKLIVIGQGPQWSAIQKKASANVELLGYQPDDVLRSYMQKAKGFIFASLEDFGIVPIEAMAAGTPVIAFGKGAARETVIEGKTGLFFHEQTAPAIQNAVKTFEKMEFSASECRKQAEKFSSERFVSQFQEFVVEKYNLFKNKSSL